MVQWLKNPPSNPVGFQPAQRRLGLITGGDQHPRQGSDPGGQEIKNLPAMWETWVQSLGWEDPLEKGKVTHSSILA